LDKELEKKTFDYIALLEKPNEEDVKTLKRCVELLTQFKSSIPDSQKWQQMLDAFQETIRVAESTVEKKTIH
jgi:hypothetical protein